MHKLATAYSGSAAWIASTTMASDCESESKRLIDALPSFDSGFGQRGMLCQCRGT